MRMAWVGLLGVLSSCAADAAFPSDEVDLGGPDSVGDPSAASDPSTPPPNQPPPAELCALESACDLAPPAVSASWSWRGGLTTTVMVLGGDVNHRGRDLILREGEPQWALAKFSYGQLIDKDLEGEDVDIYVLRNCATWEFLGTALTSSEEQQEIIEGVPGTPGRVYFRVPEDRLLGMGRHRFHFVVQGDGSSTDAYVQVIRGGERVVISDVDGTLTDGENSEAIATFLDTPIAANAGAADAMRAFAERGFLMFYLTARPEWEQPRTRTWLAENGFPPGIVHTTFDTIPLLGTSASDFKTSEVAVLAYRLGHVPDFAFGNKDTDLAAYAANSIAADHTYLYQYMADPMGAHVFDRYDGLMPEVQAIPAMCR